MTEPNTELAYRMLDLARANPKAFDMTSWGFKTRATYGLIDLRDLTGPACGTTACLAGWTVADAGYEFDVDGRVYKDGVMVEHPGWDADATELESLAADLLGITLEQASELFYVGENDLQVAIADIFGPRPEAAGR